MQIIFLLFYKTFSQFLLATAYIFFNLIDKICSCKFMWNDIRLNFLLVIWIFFLEHNLSVGRSIFVAIQTLGVVFGDVGTSPLYTFSVIFSKSPIDGNEDILGALSIVLYTLILFPLLKYVLVWLWWIVVISMNWSIYCVLRKGFDSLVKFWSWLVLNLTSHVWAADL